MSSHKIEQRGGYSSFEALDKMQDTEMAGVHEPVVGASGVFDLL